MRLHSGGATLIAVRSQARDDAADVGTRAVLAELELGLDAVDRHLDADDRAQLPSEELLGRIVDRSWHSTSPLVVVGESANEVTKPGGVVVDGYRAVAVGDHIVPRQYDPSALGVT